MSTTLASVIDIDATAEDVWAVLIDFSSYAEWNPFIDRITGKPVVGSKLVVHMKAGGGRGVTFKPRVLIAEPGQELRWLGRLGFGGLFDGEHFFQLAPNSAGGTQLTHGETFSGVLVALLKGTMKDTDAGFQSFNDALKQRVEAVAVTR